MKTVKPIVLEGITWQSNGGIIQNGLFTAGTSPGKYEIIAQDPKNGLQVKIPIHIQAVAAQTSGDDVANKKVKISQWQVNQYHERVGTLAIQGEVYDENASQVKVVSYNADKQEKTLYQLNIRAGQNFRITVTFIDAQALALIVNSPDNKILFKKYHPLPQK